MNNIFNLCKTSSEFFPLRNSSIMQKLPFVGLLARFTTDPKRKILILFFLSGRQVESKLSIFTKCLSSENYCFRFLFLIFQCLFRRFFSESISLLSLGDFLCQKLSIIAELLFLLFSSSLIIIKRIIWL